MSERERGGGCGLAWILVLGVGLLVCLGLGGALLLLLSPGGPGFPPMTPATRAVKQGFEDLEAGKLSPAQVAALASSALTIDWAVRPRIGLEDTLVVEATGTYAAPFTYDLRGVVRVTVDGEEVRANPLILSCSGGRDPFSGFHISPARIDEQVAWKDGPWSPGSHEVRIACDLTLLHDGSPTPIWTASAEEVLRFEAVEGLPTDQITLVTSPGSAPHGLTAASNGSTQTGGRTYGGVGLSYDDGLPVSVAGRCEIRLAETGELLGTHEVLIPAGRRGASGFGFTPESLPVGRHRLKLRIVPDPALALRRSASITEIWGLPIERELEIEVR